MPLRVLLTGRLLRLGVVVTLALWAAGGWADALVSSATAAGGAAAGALSVSSDPPAAAVYVDGRFVGQTPVNVPSLPAGDHRVRVVKDGYLENRRLITVSGDKVERLHVRLTSGGQTGQSGQATGLRIVVIGGEDSVNIIQKKTAVAPIVEVRDRNDQPVAGALVTFTLRGGKAATFAGGRQTLTVTTNAAGRAAASAVTPLSSGSMQIEVQAAFQGQTATATISQTNVATAAQAAQIAGAGAGAAVGAGTAAGAAAGGAGGGGLLGATIAIIGAAAGAGAVVATKAGGGGGGGGNNGPSSRTYTGPFNGQVSVTTTTFNANNNTMATCVSTRATSGTLKMTLEQRSDGTVTGSVQTTGTETEIAFTMLPFCSSGGGGGLQLNWDLPVTGTAGNLAFRGQTSFTSNSNGVIATSTETLTFSGALADRVVSGTMIFSHMVQGNNLLGNTSSSSGSTSFPVTLR